MDSTILIWFFASLIGGLLLIIAEIFVPGGIVGFLGGVALLLSMGIALTQFPAPWGVYAALAIIALGGLFLVLWIQLFPKTRMGRRITLQVDSADYKSAAPPNAELLGVAGEAATPLRPGGIALLNGKRVDVLADGADWIDPGTRITVTAIRDGQILVAPTPADSPS